MGDIEDGMQAADVGRQGPPLIILEPPFRKRGAQGWPWRRFHPGYGLISLLPGGRGRRRQALSQILVRSGDGILGRSTPLK